MKSRRIGSELETRYADLTGPGGYSPRAVLSLWMSLVREIVGRYLADRWWNPIREVLVSLMGPRIASKLRAVIRDHIAPRRVNHEVAADHPTLLCSLRGYNIVKVKNEYYAAPQSVGDLDLSTEEGKVHPDLLVAEDYKVLLEKVHVASRG